MSLLKKLHPSGLRRTHRWGINNGNSLNDLLLVRLGTGAVEVADDGGHTSLVAESGSQVDGLLGVILGEGLDTAAVAGTPLPGKVSERTVARGLVLAVRPRLLVGHDV